jgi:hypothetical protein
MNIKVNRLVAKLELDPRADAVAGTITGDDGVKRPFSGWMELANAIETWRTENGSDTGEGTTQATDRAPTGPAAVAATNPSDTRPATCLRR